MTPGQTGRNGHARPGAEAGTRPGGETESALVNGIARCTSFLYMLNGIYALIAAAASQPAHGFQCHQAPLQFTTVRAGAIHD